MGFEELYKTAVKAKATKPLIPVLLRWETEGEYLVGRLINISDQQSTMGEGSYHMYVVESDNGLFKFSLGAVADANLENLLHVGKVYAFLYQGKEDLPGGRRVNRFEVFEVPEGGGVDPPPDDVPF